MSEEDVIELTDRNWEEIVESADLPVAVMFYDLNCPHCRAMMPYFLQLAGEFRGRVVFGRTNARNNPYAINRYGVMAVPTFKFFCGGRPVQDIVGQVDPGLLRRIVEDAFQYGQTCVSRSTPISFTAGYV